MYTLREFRKNTKQAFDDAFQGHEVVVKRNGELYQLVALSEGPLKGHSFESIPKKTPILKPIVHEVARVVPEFKPCKHGMAPKFCKFAQPGRPCK